MTAEYNERIFRKMMFQTKILFDKWSHIREPTDELGSKALRRLFDEEVIKGSAYERRYNDEVTKHQHNGFTDVTVYDYPIVRELNAILKEYGWRQFLSGLRMLARNYATSMAVIGMARDQARWNNIESRIEKIPKTARVEGARVRSRAEDEKEEWFEELLKFRKR